MSAAEPLPDDETASLVERIRYATWATNHSPRQLADALGYMLAALAVRHRVSSRSLTEQLAEQHRAVRLASRTRH